MAFLAEKIKGLLAYPGVAERVELMPINLLSLFAVLSLFFIVARSRFGQKGAADIAVYFFMGTAIANMLLKNFRGYSYDSSIGFLCILSDLILCITCMHLAISYFFPKRGIKGLLIGLSALTFLGIAILQLGINALVTPEWFSWLNIGFTSVGLFFVYRSREKISEDLRLCSHSDFLVVLICLAPFLPYFMTPAPPDMDVVATGDILGFTYQGFKLNAVKTGLFNDQFAIRYPAGITGLGWLISALLDLRAPDSLLLLWILSFWAFVAIMVDLGRAFNLPKTLCAFLCLNIIVTGSHGLHGGQIQELLAYSLGVFAISSILRQEAWQGFLAAYAAILIHPIVALPFCSVIWIVAIVDLIRNKISMRHFVLCAASSVAPLLYFVSLIIGQDVNPSQPEILLRELTPSVFVENIRQWIVFDSMGLYPVIAIIAALAFYEKYRRVSSICLLWFVFACSLDGVFGHTKWVVRFHGSFSTVALFILSLGLAANMIWRLVGNKPLGVRAFCLTALLSAWWFVNRGPGFRLMPESVFVTFSDIRMGRYIEANLPRDVLIANIRPPNDPGSLGNGCGFFARGITSRHALNYCLGSHQIKGQIDSENRTKVGACQPNSPDYARCLHQYGVDYIFLDARPDSKEFARKLQDHGALLQRQIGQSYLFAI